VAEKGLAIGDRRSMQQERPPVMAKQEPVTVIMMIPLCSMVMVWLVKRALQPWLQRIPMERSEQEESWGKT
jgi:hypothetical protein